MLYLLSRYEKSENSKPSKDPKPPMDANAISKIVVDTLVVATKKSDTKNRMEDALKNTPVSQKKIEDALTPSKITSSQSTTISKSTNGTTGAINSGSKPQEKESE